MATVTSNKVADTVTRRTQHEGLTSVVASYTIPATGDGTAANDIIQMVKVPKGAVILDLKVAITDVDTNATPTHVFDVGDGDDVDRFIDGSTKGQGGGLAVLGDSVAAAVIDNALGYAYTADDTIDVKVVTASATKAAGVLVMSVIYAQEA